MWTEIEKMKGEITMSEVKMTDREEIFFYLKGAIQEELNRIRNDFEFGEIEKSEFEELTDEVEQTFVNCLTEMALANDKEVLQKMSDVLGCNFKRKIKGL